jgi:hypothetical protein
MSVGPLRNEEDPAGSGVLLSRTDRCLDVARPPNPPRRLGQRIGAGTTAQWLGDAPDAKRPRLLRRPQQPDNAVHRSSALHPDHQ